MYINKCTLTSEQKDATLKEKWCNSMEMSVLVREECIHWQMCLKKAELKPAIYSHHRGLLCQKILPHHENAHLYMAHVTFDTIQRFQILKHPPYSSDLAPCDYHVWNPERHCEDKDLGMIWDVH